MSSSEPSPGDAGDRAARSARTANVVALAALVLSAASVLFTAQQAAEATRANDQLEIAQARNVYLDLPQEGPGGQRDRYIRNRNKEPITRVGYTYEVSGRAGLVTVVVGSLPGCTSAKLTPQGGDEQNAEFRPLAVYFTDPSGQRWRRDAGMDPVRMNDSPALPDSPDTLGSTTPIDDC